MIYPLRATPLKATTEARFVVWYLLIVCYNTATTMVDLSQWRASIGGWNSHCTSYCCPSSSPNKISAVGDCLGALSVLCGCQVMMSLLSVVLGLRLILLLSGDIELNPGPGQPPELDDVFRLLKSHSADWQDIGRALGVNKNFRDGVYRDGAMKNNDTKLEDVLHRWIQSQCSEVSWDHLIEVLQDDLADTVSKIKEYLLNNDKAKKKYQWKDGSVVTDVSENTSTVAGILSSFPSNKDQSKHDGVVYNSPCGWMSCKFDLLSLALVLYHQQNNIDNEVNLSNLSSSGTNVPDSDQATSKLPSTLDLRCARGSGICHSVFFSSNYHMTYGLLSSIFKSREVDRCKKLARRVFSMEFCTSRIQGHADNLDIMAVLYFLQHSDTTWDIVHLYPGRDGISDVNLRHSIYTKTLKVFIQSDNALADTLLRCINYMSHEYLECFDCHLISDFDSSVGDILIRLLKLPCPSLKKVIFTCPFRLKTETTKELIDTIANNTTIRELQLSTTDEFDKITTNTFVKGVARNNMITSLVIEASCFDLSEAHAAIKELLKNNRKLERLRLRGTCINFLEINEPIETPLKDVDVSSIKLTEHIVCNLKGGILQSLTVNFCEVNRESLRRIVTSLSTNHPKLSRLNLVMARIRNDEANKMVIELLKSVKSLEVLVIDLNHAGLSFSLLAEIHNNLRSLKHFELVGISTVSSFPIFRSVSSELSNILSSNGGIEVLKIPIKCTDELETFIEKMSKLKQLKNLELTIFMTGKTDGYQITAGVLSVMNRVLDTCHGLKELVMKVQTRTFDGVCFGNEAYIRNDPLLQQFSNAVVSHSCLEYITIKLGVHCEKWSWVSDIHKNIRGSYPEGKVPPIIDFT